MSLINAYLQVLNEGKNTVGNLKAGADFVEGGTDSSPLKKQDGIEEPKKGLSQTEGDGKLKEFKGKSLGLKGESSNPFDVLYNKILAQENWEQEEEANSQPEMGAPSGDMELNFSGSTEPEEGAEEEGGEDEDPMIQVLDALKSAVAALEKVVGSSEEEEEEEGEGEEEEEEEEENPFSSEETPFGEETESEDSEDESAEDEKDVNKEAVEAQELGTALIDLEKLAASLTNPKNQVVKGAVPVNKGKAQVPKGGKVDGKLSELGDKSATLQSKKTDTGGVSNGKNWFDQ